MLRTLLTIWLGSLFAISLSAQPTTFIEGWSIRTYLRAEIGSFKSVFTIEGDSAKQMLIRGIGPKLADLGMSEVLSDPRLEVLDANSGELVASNDNWDSSLASVFTEAGAFSLNPNSNDAALHVSLDPGTYEVRLTGAAGESGTCLLEIQTTDDVARLVYGNVLVDHFYDQLYPTLGLVISGSGSEDYILRALGRTLGSSDAAHVTTLPLFREGTFLDSGTTGGTGSIYAEIAGIMPLEESNNNSGDADLHYSLEPAAYTIPVYVGWLSQGFVLFEFAAADASRDTEIPAAIVAQPRDFEPDLGTSFSLGVVANGLPAPTFQWFHNNAAVAGANDARLTVNGASLEDIGNYHVVVSQGGNSITSASASVELAGRPIITDEIDNTVYRPGDHHNLHVASSGNTPFEYEWTKDGVVLVGQTGSSLNLSALASETVAGEYTVSVTNNVSSATSSATVQLAGRMDENDAWLAAGKGGTLLRSADATAWQSVTTGTTLDLHGVASNGSVSITVGDGGTLLISSDFGVSWSSHNVGTAANLNAITAGPDQFVIVGQDGIYLLSTDGTNWTEGRVPTWGNRDLYDIVYANGLYIAVGEHGSLFTSPDGINWTNRNSETLNDITDIGYADDFWARDSQQRLFVSSNGINWNLADGHLLPQLNALAANGATIVAVGDAGEIQTSADGVAWDQQDSTVAGDLFDATWTGAETHINVEALELFSDLDMRILKGPLDASGILGRSVRFTVNLSGGGHTYQWLRDGVPISGATHESLILTNLEINDTANYSVEVTGAGGVLTSAEAKLRFFGTGTLGSQFIVVGADGVLLTSHDGVSFDPQITPGSPLLRAVAASAYRAVAVGQGGIILRSLNAESWEVVNSPTVLNLRGVTTGISRFVAVGSSGLILVSEDQGATWAPADSPTQLPLWSVAWNGMYFLAVGESGVALTSPDGWNWSLASSPTTKRFYGVGLNGSAFVALTEDGASYTTMDGSAWAPGIVSGSWWVRGAAVNNAGMRITAGDFGLLATSTDGVNWTRRSTPTLERLYGATWTGAPAPAFTDLDSALEGPALRIETAPENATVTAGSTVTLAATAAGLHPLVYQWQRNGIAIPNATSPSLILANVQSHQAGNYNVLVADVTGVVESIPATLLIETPPPGIPASITSSPVSRGAFVGSTTTFEVLAAGDIPLSYQWYFNGNAIAGATSSSLNLTNLQLANAGSYSVTVRNAFGSATSSAAVLGVENADGAPVITSEPVGLLVSVGDQVAFSLTAAGDETLVYQWSFNGVAINGANDATFDIASATTDDAGSYTVQVSNAKGVTTSRAAGLTVVPIGMSAAHSVVGRGYDPGETLTITNTFNYVGEADALGWDVLLPAGWSFVESAGAEGDIKPETGDTEILGWAWTEPAPSPVTFTYSLQAPANASGDYTLATLAIARQGGVPIEILARPDPLILSRIPQFHSADVNQDHQVNLQELLRVIELYNSRNGTVRTGRYAVQDGTEDGFIIDTQTTSDASVQLERYHSADYTQDGKISLQELLRVIELYNVRDGTVRTGNYRVQAETEDGFAPGL